MIYQPATRTTNRNPLKRPCCADACREQDAASKVEETIGMSKPGVIYVYMIIKARCEKIITSLIWRISPLAFFTRLSIDM